MQGEFSIDLRTKIMTFPHKSDAMNFMGWFVASVLEKPLTISKFLEYIGIQVIEENFNEIDNGYIRGWKTFDGLRFLNAHEEFYIYLPKTDRLGECNIDSSN